MDTQSKKYTILVVEDDKSISNVLRDKLTIEGFNVLQAYDGQIGVEIALREHPDLILLDILMPVMDGITVLKNLQKDAWGKMARIIMLTNLADNENISMAIANGSNDYLVKSNWSMKDLVSKIRKRLETPRS